MARPTKEGLEYFPLDVTLDDKFKIIEAIHGLLGFAIVIKLLQKIYSEGYYYEWEEMQQILFSNSISVDRNLVTKIVSDCIKWGLFDETLFKKYQILTSRGIQRRYIQAIYKRTNVEMIKEYLLIDISDRKNISCISVSDVRNDDTTIVSDVNNSQSKVKESKVNKSKVNIYIVEQSIDYASIIDYLNAICGTNYKHTTRKTRDLIKARFNEGFTLGDFKTVIDKKAREWKNDPKMSKYLRPETLFGTKFESYLNQQNTDQSKHAKHIVPPPSWMSEEQPQQKTEEPVDSGELKELINSFKEELKN